jgi:hypothetical protein
MCERCVVGYVKRDWCGSLLEGWGVEPLLIHAVTIKSAADTVSLGSVAVPSFSQQSPSIAEFYTPLRDSAADTIGRQIWQCSCRFRFPWPKLPREPCQQ